MNSLCEKYRPLKINEFVGLAKPKQTLTTFAAAPFGSAWLFIGRSGSGKTAMALALAGEIGAEVHRMPSQECTRENIERVWQRCHSHSVDGKARHLILVDQADYLTLSQQSYFFSKLDTVASYPDIVWVFTAIESDRLDRGFRTRLHNLSFSTHGVSKDAVAHLERIWAAETMSTTEPLPNFVRIVKEANNSLRASIMVIESKLLVSNRPN